MEDLLFDFINKVIRNIIFENLNELLGEIENDDEDNFLQDLWKLMVEKHGEGIDASLVLDKFRCTKHELNSNETVYIFHLPITGIPEPTFYSALYVKNESDSLNQRYFKFQKREEDENLVQLCEWHFHTSGGNAEKDIMFHEPYDEKYEANIEEFIKAIKSKV